MGLVVKGFPSTAARCRTRDRGPGTGELGRGLRGWEVMPGTEGVGSDAGD